MSYTVYFNNTVCPLLWTRALLHTTNQTTSLPPAFFLFPERTETLALLLLVQSIISDVKSQFLAARSDDGRPVPSASTGYGQPCTYSCLLLL